MFWEIVLSVQPVEIGVKGGLGRFLEQCLADLATGQLVDNPMGVRY